MPESENGNLRPVRLVFCPLEQEAVDILRDCAPCPLWDGRECGMSADVRIRRSSSRIRQRLEKSLLKRSARPRRKGRRLNMPPVWERWPDESRNEAAPHVGEETDYGEAGLVAGNVDVPPEPWEQEASAPDDSGLEELLREIGEPLRDTTAQTLDLPVLPEPDTPPQVLPGSPEDSPFPLPPLPGAPMDLPPDAPPAMPGGLEGLP